jgi:penicillin amidase
MRAGTIEEALAAGEDFVAPAQNLMLASADGRIAMQVIGHMPWRSTQHATQARMPSPGWEEDNRWLGVTQYFANPSFVDPEGGLLGNTNNKTVDRDFPLHVTFDWGDTQRITRLTRLMQDREVHTRDSFVEAQLDTVSAAARNILPLVARELWFIEEAAPEGTPDRRRQRALELLAEWNGEMNEHLPEPLIYAAWMRALQQRLIRDELGPLADEFWQVEPVFIERVFRDIERGGGMVRRRAVDGGRELHRDRAPRARRRHPGACRRIWQRPRKLALGRGARGAARPPGAGRHRAVVVDREHPPADIGRGFHPAARRDAGRRAHALYANTHAAGYRGVYDFADPDSSVFITATGQSGHPLSRHYDDLGELWRRGEYVPMTLDPDLARAGNLGVSILTPR